MLSKWNILLQYLIRVTSLYYSDIEDVGIVCQRLDCESSDVDCVLNKTKSIQWQFIALPSIPVVQKPLVIPFNSIAGSLRE